MLCVSCMASGVFLLLCVLCVITQIQSDQYLIIFDRRAIGQHVEDLQSGIF